ncbi:IspD/TarI family cytidylyltransferase [Oribacterium sp. WCC10]|uniref:IspD/TarI family cytidylyltransferase n=1 Tax=Oribacterium sp. WCC10 TaxID=1855343 RepID=UPI0008E6B46E|nr:2-C-methyl-D-erythritol 4-phosphate cytidylyltransferase [Oribacterium sp. WCC10]SFG50494.1 2-C-methyl-D-erythritol 4-phosphate cytidylyltransferase [Oribacterium sp. WCC10]
MYEGRKVYAIILAAGSGRRMHSKEKKQFMKILDKPLFCWSAEKFDSHPSIDGIIITTADEDIPYMKTLTCFNDITGDKDTHEKTYPLQKIKAIVKGGKERYNSVFNGLDAIREIEHIATTDNVTSERTSDKGSFSAMQTFSEPIVLIHDCARPMVNSAIIDDAIRYAFKYHAAVIGMPVKDTIKIIDDEHFVKSTPERSSVWLMETPQSFDFSLIYGAYSKLIAQEKEGRLMIPVTDDAMVVESFSGARVRVVAGTYENIKVTTPEDVKIAELYLRNN